jgi:hypothetical protein
MKAPPADGPKGRVIEDGISRGAFHGDIANGAGLGDKDPKQSNPFPALLAGEERVRRRRIAVVTGHRFDEGSAGAHPSLFEGDGGFRLRRR